MESHINCKCGSKFSNIRSLQKHLRRNHNHWPEQEKTKYVKLLTELLHNINQEKKLIEKAEIAKAQTQEQRLKINVGFENFQEALFKKLKDFEISPENISMLKNANTLELLKSKAQKLLTNEMIRKLILWGFDLELKPKSNISKIKSKSQSISQSKIIYTPMGNKR